MDLISLALRIATEAHAGQSDKAGQPYVLHPIRMALRLQTEDEKVTALLHDIVEDCPGWSFERLATEGIPERIIEALRLVTKDPKADLSDEQCYMAFVRAAATNPIARAVKRADLVDNSDLSRIASPAQRDHERVAKYARAVRMLDDQQRSGTRDDHHG